MAEISRSNTLQNEWSQEPRQPPTFSLHVNQAEVEFFQMLIGTQINKIGVVMEKYDSKTGISDVYVLLLFRPVTGMSDIRFADIW